MMKIPYSCLAAHGDILFAARGGQIQTFRVAGSAPLSTWRHPAAEAEEKASKPPPNSQTDNSVTNAGEQLEQVALAPPIKKQMLEDSSENKEAPEGESAGIGANGNDVEESGGGKRRKKNDKKKFTVHRGPISRQTDLHVIILMALTSDGGHLVAVSGHDKAIWVFEHDGNGQLTELSRRIMPKRPSDIAISPDGTIILAADKFGDVYALPLDPTTMTLPSNNINLAVKHAREDNKPAANEFTVHSKINLRSLEMQHRANERQAKQKDQEAAKDGGAHAFEHALLLGHVSMLTAITIGLHEGQSFIITADRDEHIKVSRYIPQAYHIENFCLGHREFVNSLHIPGQVPGILISGGGDDELFIWDWRQGRLLSRTHIVPSSSPERPAQKIAVLRICSSNELVFVICESQPFLFRFALKDNALSPLEPTTLDFFPLDIVISPVGAHLILALDPSSSTAPNSNGMPESNSEQQTQLLRDLSPDGTSSTQPILFDESATEGKVLEMKPDEVKKLLYSTEQLRKMRAVHAEDEDDEDWDMPTP